MDGFTVTPTQVLATLGLLLVVLLVAVAGRVLLAAAEPRSPCWPACPAPCSPR
jgi:hypothetical protein